VRPVRKAVASMTDFFIEGRTFAAPFVSEPIERYVEADTAEAALTQLAEKMKDGIGLFAADAYATADDYHRGRKPLARWRSNKALAIEGAGSIYSKGPGHVEIDGESHTIDDPKGGRVLA
jgi:hypothetical protein